MDVKNLFKNRVTVVLLIVVITFTVLATRAFTLQVILGEENALRSIQRSTKEQKISGLRGNIVDVNGKVLAYDEKCFNIEFFRDYSSSSYRAMYTQSIIDTIRIVEANGLTIEPEFSIQRNEAGEFAFQWGNVTAEQAASREKTWRKNFYVDEDDTPYEIFMELSDRFKIPVDLSEEDTLKVLGVWQDSILSTYAAKPIVIVRNVDYKVVAEIGTNSTNLEGMRISEGTRRVYPYGSTAAHIIGYMGKISANDKEKYVNERGYSLDDYVGVSGVEKTLEEHLTGNGSDRVGKKVVESDAGGEIINEISYVAPTNGDNVVLTIDINMQMKLEEALAENIALIRQEEERIYESNKSYYEALVAKRGGKEIEFAQTGAAVVMDVDTGNILAMASYPSYDLNLFANGISQKDLNSLLDDPAKPLFNNAISSMGTPGSVFKMVTGVAGLSEEVITVEEQIEDEGEYKRYLQAGSNDSGPKCWIYRDAGATHGDENVEEAIKDSCNYFFFTVADRLGISKLSQWAHYFGLDAKTNVELPGEFAGQVAAPEVLYDPSRPVTDQKSGTAVLVYRAINKRIAEEAKESGAPMDDASINRIVDKVFQLIDLPRDTKLKNIAIMLKEETKINTKTIDIELKYHIADYLDEITWTPTDTITAGIGQSITMLTPIGVARYISSLVNGGYVYDAHVVDKVVDRNGKVVADVVPTVYRNLNVQTEYLEAIKQGMKDVVAGDDSSTANKYFKDFKYTSQMGGKTGTAQVSTINLENNSWFVSFAPFDEPEIAVVVYIPHGYSGGMSAYTNKEIAEYYLNAKAENTPAELS